MWSQFDSDELYNLNDDLLEMRNMADDPSFGEVKQEARHQIQQMLAKNGPGVFAWCLEDGACDTGDL